MEPRSAGAIFGAGGLQQWTHAFLAGGGGARGRAAGSASISRNYPGASAATLRVIEREGLAGLSGARRYSTARDDYVLPANAYADLSSYQRRSGTEGETMYGHRVEFKFFTRSASGKYVDHTRTLIIKSAGMLTKDALMNQAYAQANMLIASQVATSFKQRGATNSAPYDLKLQSAFRFVE